MARKKKSPPKPFYNKELAKMFDASDAAAYKSSALQPFKKFLKRHSTIYGNSWQNRKPLPPSTGAPSGPGRRTDTPPKPTPITSGLGIGEMASRTQQDSILEQKKYEALSSVYSGQNAQHHTIPDWMNRKDSNPWVLKSANKLQISKYQKNLQNMYKLKNNNKNQPTGGSGGSGNKRMT